MMMTLYIEKDTDLMRSTFMAVGLAKLFHALARGREEVRIVDQGGAYAIAIPYDADRAHALLRDRTEERLPPIIPAIRKNFSAGEQKELDADPDSLLRFKYVPQGFSQSHTVEYGAERDTVKAAPKGKAKSERQEGDSAGPHRDYPLWAHFCSYFGKGSAMRSGYPAVLHTWHAHQGDHAHTLLDLIMETFSEPFADIDAFSAQWTRDVLRHLTYPDYELAAHISALAIVSPTTSKGGFSTTGAALLTENTPDESWLVMLLAFAGFMTVAMPYNRGSDVLTFYPLPRDIGYDRLSQEMDAFRASDAARRLYSFSNLTERVKLDSLAALTFYRAIVDQATIEKDPFWIDAVIEAHGGLVGYYYKDIGGTQIPFDEVLFALPRWLPDDAALEALEEARALLKAHYEMIDGIRGKSPGYKMTADELVVLNSYRSFLTRGEAELWIEFAIAYNLYRFRNMPDVYLPELHLITFERTLMSIHDRIDYRPILTNEGFRRIASAIRSATVLNRFLEDVRHIETGFRTRHGLGDDLLRDAADPELFMMAVSSFVHDYARESANVQAKDANRWRPFVTDADLVDLAGLVAEYGSRVVAHLLVATGYASDRKDKTTE